MSKTKWLFTIIGVILCIVLFSATAFGATITTPKKADVLNKVNLLKGNGIDYDLDGQLKRSEAAAFIVKLMGEETNVLNQSKYKVSSFPDVAADSWYAPFIAFSKEQKIVSGFPDGNFHPEDFVSEKAFLTMVLGAFEYKADVDFNWGDVLQVAYKYGFVTDSKYQNATSDQTDYIRGDVVQVLYNALQIKFHKSEKTLIESLIDKDVTTREDATSAGIFGESLVTDIHDISVLHESNLIITLNEDIRPLDVKNILVYETNNNNSSLNVAIESQASNEIHLTTTPQLTSLQYTIRITDVIDMDGNIVNRIEKEFTAYQAPEIEIEEIKSDFFKISKIEPISNNLINVYFTQPINLNSELPFNYELISDGNSVIKGDFQSITVKLLGSYNNAITILFKDKGLTPSRPYALKVSGALTSNYGVALNDGLGDSMSFVGVSKENESFYVTGVTPVDRNVIEVRFNKDVDPSEAGQYLNYSLKGPDGFINPIVRVIVSDVGIDRWKSVKLVVGAQLDKDKSYELTIKGVKDRINLNTIPEMKYPLIGPSMESNNLAIANITALDKGTIAVYFNRPIDPITAVDTINYAISGSVNAMPIKVFFDSQKPYMVKLFLSGGLELNSSNTYKLSVSSSLQDELGNNAPSNLEFTFNGSNDEVMKPWIYDAHFIGKDTILIQTTKEVSSASLNASTINYKLEYTEGSSTRSITPTGITMINATTIVLKFDSLSIQNYTLKFDSLQDYSGYYTRTSTDGLNSIGVTLGNS